MSSQTPIENTKSAVHSTVAANEFIELARENGKSLTQMQLQKLVYIAHGWSLELYNQSLTSDDIKAYEFGPVYPDLGVELRRFGKEPVNERIGSRLEMLSDKQSALLREVFKAYGDFNAWQLSALTHQDGAPWNEVYDNGRGKFNIIPDNKIKAHFHDIAEQSNP